MFSCNRNFDQGTTTFPSLGDPALAQQEEGRAGSNSMADGPPLSQAQRHAPSSERPGLDQSATQTGAGKPGRNQLASKTGVGKPGLGQSATQTGVGTPGLKQSAARVGMRKPELSQSAAQIGVGKSGLNQSAAQVEIVRLLRHGEKKRLVGGKAPSVTKTLPRNRRS